MSCAYLSKAVTLKDFDRICRTCLGDENVSPIVGSSIGDLKVVDLLANSVMIEVNQDDFLPQNICEICLNNLYKVHEFKKQCQENEAALKLLTENIQETDKTATELDSSNIPCIKEDEEIIFEPSDSEKEPDHAFKDEEKDTAPEQNKCGRCGYTASTKQELSNHRKATKHRDYRKNKCELCDKRFTPHKLRQHMHAHTKERPYQCEICHRNFAFTSNLKRHKLTHTDERPHLCSICGKGFIQVAYLHAHEKLHQAQKKLAPESTGALKFTCNFCGLDFKRLALFNAHVEKHTSDSIVKKDSCDHICDICGRGYSTKQTLKSHLLTHSERSFLCNVCGKSFTHVGTLNSHMLIHSGLKPYCCSLCTKSFTQSSQLRSHLRSHSGEKPYQCSHCSKKFAFSWNLTVHMRSHTGETPYVCHVCGKGFSSSSGLQRHKRTHKEA